MEYVSFTYSFWFRAKYPQKALSYDEAFLFPYEFENVIYIISV